MKALLKDENITRQNGLRAVTGQTARARSGTAIITPQEAAISIARSTTSPDLQRLVLHRDRGRDLEQALQWLSASPDPSLLRLTGGCLGTDPKLALRAKSTLAQVLREFSECMILAGGTQSCSMSDSRDRRPCIPEVAMEIQSIERKGKILGVLPGQELGKLPSGMLAIERGDSLRDPWNVVVDSRLTRAVVSEIESTRKWDSEWRTSLDIAERLKTSNTMERAVLLGFDGGLSTLREFRAWAEHAREHPKFHLLLVRGGAEDRAVDTLARSWRATRNKQIHIVDLNAEQISAALARIGFKKTDNSFSGAV